MSTLFERLAAGEFDRTDPEVLLFFARRAQKAYASEAEIALSLAKAGGEMLRFEDTGSCEFFAARFPGFHVLSFRGTETDKLEDVITDLKMRRERTSDCPVSGSVHRGFLDAFLKARGSVEETIASFCGSYYITGHSLGGASAVLAGAFTTKNRPEAVFTFGCPRIGNAEFAEFAADNNHIRVVNAADAVPRLPPYFLGYRHDCDPLYLKSDGRLIDGAGLWSRLIDFGLDMRASARQPVKRHSMENYISQLERLAA